MGYGEMEQSMEGADLGKKNDLIYELPVGAAVARGGHELYLEIANREFLKATGYFADDIMERKRPFVDYIYEADVGIFEDAIEKCRENREIQSLELRVRTKDGGVCWEMLQCRLYCYRDAVPYYILISWDIHTRKGLEEELRLMDEQYRMLEEVTDEFPFDFDVVKKRFRVPQKYRVNGKVDSDRKYMSFEEMLADVYEEDRAECAQAILLASKEKRTGTIDYRMNLASEGEKTDYSWYRTVYRSIVGDDGQIIRIIGRSYDVSKDRKIQEQLLEEMRLDPMTRVLNKVAAGEEVDRILTQEPQGTHVLLLIDIDDFKQINDTFGHTVGDTVISDVADVIRQQFGENDLVARMGGDEFLAFMRNTTRAEAERKAEQLCGESAKRLIGDDAIVNVTLSIGLAVSGEDGDDYETLFTMADRAMYDTKRDGKNGFAFARKDSYADGDGRRRQKNAEVEQNAGREVDKEFLNFAFSLLSHARDINGSLNVLIEQIGKKYGLDFVAVFEGREEGTEMVLMNSWNRSGRIYEHHLFQQGVCIPEEVQMGQFVSVSEDVLAGDGRQFGELWRGSDEGTRHLGGVKFEFSGNRMGWMCVGVRREGEGFHSDEASTFCELGRVVGVFVSLRSKLSDDQREIQHLQNQDMLTGLYNLEAFRERTKRRMKRGELAENKEDGTRRVYALVHLDVNNFSYVNENFGQQVGDSILRELAKLIDSQEHVVEACRMYSDYFVELVCGSSEKEIYNKVLEENAAFEEQQKIRYPASMMRLSAGICFVRDHKESFDTIIEGANLARKQAKEQKIGAVVYRESMRRNRDNEIHITGRFYGALQKGELELFLQPKFLLEERRIYGAEALARWRLESGEVISPGDFIPPLENVGYVVDLDFYILEQLLRVMRRWKESGRKLFTISTNFSRRNFENGGEEFIKRLEETMQRYQIERRYIEIEVTESVVVENLDCLKECLGKLEKLGYRIAIDDFGTGYSSLSVLLEIPANAVKIDKSFTDRINLVEQREFVSRMGQFILTAKDEVIFEGIEEEAQRQFLIGCGFRYGQGYYFDRPLSLEEFERKYI